MAKIGSVIEKQRTQGVTSKHAQAKKEKKAAAQAKRATHKSTISKAELPKTETVKTTAKLPGKTSGGFYSQPDFFSAAEEKKAGVESARNTMNQKAQALRLANNQVERISGSLKEQEDRIAKLSTAASSGARFAKSLYDVARKNYTDTYNKYETATAAAQKAAADYEPTYGLYAAAVDDFNAYITDQGAQYDAWRATIRSADDVAAEIDQLDKQIESTKKKLTAAQMRNQYAGQYDAAAGFPEWVNNEVGDIAAMEAELKNLQDQRALLGEESEWAKYFGYEEIRNAPDFAEKSQYKPTENGKEEKFNALSGMYTETGFDDITYDFINKNQKAMEHQMVNDIANNASFLGLDQNFLKQMTDDEVRIFNYLYATDGPEKAYAYISDLEADLTKRQRTAEEAQWQQYAKDSPVGSSVFSVLESPLKGLSYLGQIADYAADQKMDQNAGYNKFSYLNTAIRDEVSQDIEKNWGGVGSFAYQTGMSMADFLFNTALSGGNQALALGIMGSGAAADTTIRSKDRGLTDGQAMALGTIAGLAEVITEKVSMDALLKGDWTKSALGFIGKNVLAEGSEEGAADLINIFADVLISKDKSEWSQSIEEYKKQGMNEQDAFLKALEDQLLAIGLDMLGGGISGGVLSGGRVAIGKAGAAAQNAENTKAAGAAIRSMGDNMIDAIIEQGMEFDETTKSHELAVKAREKRAAGKTLSDAEIGRLYQETSRELDKGEAKASETAQGTQDQAPAAEDTAQQTNEEEVEEPVQEAQLQTEAQRRLTETAAQYGVDAKTTARVRRISDAVKRNVEFYQDEDAAQNGYYDRSTGTIFVNANSKNPVAQIIGHELTHSIEDAGSYQKLQAVVFRQMERNGINLEQLRQKKKELYARHGVELNDQTAIDSEIVAQYMEKNLLTDETSIRALVKDDRTVGQKIMDQIDKLLAALGNKNAQERVFLTKVRRIYADALNETAQGTQDQAPAAEKKSRKQRRAEEEQQQRDKQAERTEEKVRSTTMDKEELAAAYAAGEITEEEFDSAMESIMSDENEAGEDLLGKPVEYSIDENYARDIDEWDRAGRPDGEIFIMGDTGDVLQGLGAMDQDIYIRSEKISTILQEHQEMTLEEIKRIPEILDDPVLVLKSRNRVRSQYRNSRLVLFGTVKATDGRPVLCTLDLRPVENGLLVDDMQKVNSAYTKDVKPEEFMKRSDVLHADKKRTGSLLRDVGFKRPASLLRSGSMGSISYSGKSVNLEGVPFEQVVDTESDARRYSFGGENARRADLDALEQAKKMELQGVAADTIFRETGWFTGADGKWRFEIDGRTWEDLLEEKIDTDKEPGYNEKNVLSGNITEEEKGALLSYKSSESYKINAALRDGNTLTSEQARLVKKIDRALQKLPTYRGMANRHISFDLQGEEAMKKFLESHGEGEFVQYLAYTSASTDPEGYLVEGDLTVSIMIESETGRNLEGYGNNFESEILFPRNSVFYVDRVEMDSDGKPVIYIEEVTKNGIKRSGGQLYPEKQYGGVQQVQEIQEGNADLRKVQGVDSGTETGGAVRRIRAEDSAGNELTQQQKDFFKDSKARNASGKLLVLYHQTGNDFTVFDTRHEGAGTSDNETPFGIFMKPTDENIGLRGGKQMELYANITNPLVVEERGDLIWRACRMSDGYDQAMKEIERADVEYERKSDEMRRAIREYMMQWRSENPGASRVALYDDATYNEMSGREDQILDEWDSTSRQLAKKAKEELRKALKENGYDGVFLKNDRGSFGRVVSAYIALEPEQVKLTSNTAPTEDPDIRFSIGYDTDWRTLSENQQRYFENSVVRDESGRLMVLYHGSTSPLFTEFNTDNGVWMTPEESYARAYADVYDSPYADTAALTGMEADIYMPLQRQRMYEVYADLRNVVDLGEINGTLNNKKLTEIAAAGIDAGTLRAVAKPYMGGSVFEMTRSKEFLDLMRNAGFDGMYAEEGGVPAFCAIGIPEQIKLTSNKNPSQNPDIRYSVEDQGNELTKQQEKFFGESKVRDENGNLMQVYHSTWNEEFYVFDKNKLGENTDDFASDDYMAATSHIGFWFNSNDLKGKAGSRTEKCYLNIKNPYYANSLFELADEIENGDYGETPKEMGENYKKYLEETGYDGVILEDEEFGGISYIAFEPNQIKLTSNKNPSQNPDIRYSVEDQEAEGNQEQEAQEPTQENQAQEQEIQEPDVISTLPKKAQGYLTAAERRMVNTIGNAMNVPYRARRDFLQTISREISTEYLKNGKISEETMNGLFERAYEEGRVVDEEFYTQYKDLKEYLRTVPVTISQEDASDIADYEDFRRAAFGRLRIVNEGGTPVDVVYEELQNMARELFPGQLTHPADQLERMLDVAKSIQRSEKNLDEFYGENAGEFKRWAKNEFETAVSNVLSDLRNVKRYAEDRAAKQSFEPSNLTQEQVMELYQDLKKKRKDQEKAIAKNLLTKHDEKRVNELLRGMITLEALDPETENVKGIRQVYEARQAFEDVAKKIRAWNAERRGALNDQADKFLETANEWKDKGAGILYSRETMERNIRDIVPDAELADEVIAAYFTPVHKAAADANRLKNRMRDKVREMGLSQKVADGNLVSEAHAVQLLGEAEDNIRVLENTRGKNKTRDGKTLDDWKAVVADLWENNPNLDKQKIADAVGEFRKIYDELFQQMNESRVRNGYEPINYRRGYFPHFQPGNSDGILDAFGRALGISTEVTALPTTINGLTHTFKPGIRYMGNALERIGFNTAYDAVEGFDRYIEAAADVIYQTDNIQRLRALARQTRYRTGDEGIRKQVDDVLADPRLTEAEKTDKIDKIYAEARFTLSNFVVELDEYTNLLANKKSRYDRSMEYQVGRGAYNAMKALASRVAANMVAVNPASWLTNFIPLTQGGAMVGYRELLPAMWDTLRSYKENDGFVDRSTFLTNRRGSDPLVRSWSENMSAVASSPMSWIDSFVADSLVRARYNQNLKNGLSEAASMDEADQWVAGVMADRSKGSTPTLFQRNNPLTKLFTQFQLEVNNQLSFVAKDMPRGYKNDGMKVLAAALLRFALGAFLFDELYEFFIGRRPALDPIGILNDTVGDLTGYEMPNLVELGTGALTGDAPDFKTERVNGYEAVANLTGNILESTPFVGGLLGGGRLPISNALPDAANLSKGLFNGELPMNKRISTVAKELGNPLTYVALPFGGGQLKKVFQGVKAVVQGGQYSLDSEGNKILQYPVYNDSLVDAVGNLVTGTLFGVTATEGGKEWIENNFKSFNAAQTETYLAMQELGVDGRTAFDLITSIRDAGKNGQGSTATQQRQVIYNSDAPGDAKAAAFYGLLAADSDKSVMDLLDGMGADMGETANALMKMKDADLMEGAAASNAKRQALVDAVLTDNQKIEIYREKISDSRDEDIFAFQDAGLNFNTFLEAQSAYSTINEEYKGASRKALEFSRWVNRQGFTEEQAAVVKDSFAYYSMVPQSGGTYDKFVGSGLSDESAYQISTALEELEPEEGEESVSKMQRYKAVTNSGLSEEEQMQALSAVMTEAEYGRLKAGYDAGVTPESYVKFKEVLPKYDADGNGSYKQEEVEAAIKSIPGLSNAQRAALWQIQNKSWKPTGNPFSTSVSKSVYDDLKNAAVLPKETDSDGGIMLPKG